MPGNFRSTLFSEVNADDEFFDSLKADYAPGFAEWFAAKSATGESALIYQDDEGIGAFVYLKNENESIELADRILPAAWRLKIGTLKVANRAQGERLGEGAIGLALWRWRDTGYLQIYVTVFEKHESLVGILRKFGFRRVGAKENGESVYVKDKRELDYGNPYLSFPFIDPSFEEANLLVVNDDYHDELFPYSELANEFQDTFRSAAANGVTKTYIGGADSVAAAPDHPLLIYRKYTGTEGRPGFKSVVTSYCVVTDVAQIKRGGREIESFEKFRHRVKNKSVFSDDDIAAKYRDSPNLMVIEMVYLGYFGVGHNVNYMWLWENGYWRKNQYPLQFSFTPAEFKAILERGDVEVATLIVNQP